jgi:hypothetical protein
MNWFRHYFQPDLGKIKIVRWICNGGGALQKEHFFEQIPFLVYCSGQWLIVQLNWDRVLVIVEFIDKPRNPRCIILLESTTEEQCRQLEKPLPNCSRILP